MGLFNRNGGNGKNGTGGGSLRERVGEIASRFVPPTIRDAVPWLQDARKSKEGRDKLTAKVKEGAYEWADFTTRAVTAGMGIADLRALFRGDPAIEKPNPRYKVLFGPVSISSQYQSVSRQLIVSFLERHAWLDGWADLVSSRKPFRQQASPRHASAGRVDPGVDVEDLSAVVADIDPAQAGIPVLLRQYLKLGGKLLGFNIDPQFAHALDGLILVDLTKTDRRILGRYLGKDEAAAFLAFHRGGLKE